MRRRRTLWALLTLAVMLTGLALLQSSEREGIRFLADTDPSALQNFALDEDDDGAQPVNLDNWRGLTPEQISGMSALGRVLFVNETLVPPPPPQNRTFTILVWRHGKMLERRHLRRFGETTFSPWEGCPVSNCRLTYLDQDLASADAVVFHLHRTKSAKSLPSRSSQQSNQRWVFLTDESPQHTFLQADRGTKLSDFNGLFNWSMSYRMDSDVPVPYGRTERLPSKSPPLPPRQPRQLFAAIMGSNCGTGGNHRWDYVRQLQRLLPHKIDVYGGCGTLKCPGHFTRDCPALDQYKFYLAFENTNCREYVTEKAWWNAYHHGAIPVIMGASSQECRQLLPPGSYIHAGEFASMADLVRFLQHLDSSPSDYAAFFHWRRHFRVVNEHGYFGSPVFHYCRLCQALNYNDPKPKVYSKLEDFWNASKDCYPPYYK